MNEYNFYKLTYNNDISYYAKAKRGGLMEMDISEDDKSLLIEKITEAEFEFVSDLLKGNDDNNPRQIEIEFPEDDEKYD